MNATVNPPKPAPVPSAASCAPACGVSENLQKPLYSISGNAEAYEVRIEMPGVPKTGVKIDFENKVLTVRGERNAKVPETWKPLHRELSDVNYQLRLRLNAPVDEERLAATMENGILTLRLPVRETAKPRRIEVQ